MNGIVKGVQSNDKHNASYTGKYQDVYFDDKFSKKVVLYRGKNAVYRFLKAILKEMNYCQKTKKINKNLVMSAKDEERFQLRNNCWICNKLFDAGENRARDHCHITGKYRGSAHGSCNINLKLTKKFL